MTAEYTQVKTPRNFALADALGKAVLAEEAAELRAKAEADNYWLMQIFGYEAAYNLDLAFRVAREWDEALENGLVDLDDPEALEAIDRAYDARRNGEELLVWGKEQGWV